MLADVLPKLSPTDLGSDSVSHIGKVRIWTWHLDDGPIFSCLCLCGGRGARGVRLVLQSFIYIRICQNVLALNPFLRLARVRDREVRLR
jgi:hypothetical protein